MVPSRLKASGGRGPSLLVVAALLAALSQAIAGAPTPKPPKLPGNGRLFSSSNRTGSFQIWSYSSSGGNPQPVTSAAAGFGFALHPALSPDGRRLAFSGYVGGTWDVYVCDSKGGGNLVKLTNSPAGKLSMVPNWSPDGTRIAFESDREDASGKGLTAVYVMDASAPGAAPVRMTRSAQNDMGAKFSPDGTQILFASDRAGAAGKYDLYLTPSTGGEPAHGNATRLTNGLNNAESRSWAPDGRRIAANSNDAASGAGRIVMVDAASGAVTPLTTTNAAFPPFSMGGIFPTLQGAVTPAFSPDGKYVAYCDQTKPSGQYEVFRIRADGKGRPTRLTSSKKGAEQHVTLGWQPLPRR